MPKSKRCRLCRKTIPLVNDRNLGTDHSTLEEHPCRGTTRRTCARCGQPCSAKSICACATGLGKMFRIGF